MPPDDRPVFLVGFMGSGKSTVAARLAAALGWACEETDEAVERAAGRSIERVFREQGEARFRRLEGRALAAAAGRRRCVVATGGGAFCDAANRRLLKRSGRTVWLDVPLEVCATRVGPGRGRPLWDSADPVAFRAFFERRRAAYALAELRVASPESDADPERTVRHLLARL